MLRSSGVPIAALTVLVAAAGCPPAAYSVDHSPMSGSGSGSGSSATEEPGESSGTSGPTSGGSEGDPATEGTEGTTASAPEPGQGPEIVKVTITPQPVTELGSFTVEVETRDVEYVETEFLGEPFELLKVEPDRFVGEIAIHSSLFNGTHALELTPIDGQDEGETEVRDVLIDLPQAGTDEYWEATPGIGEGLAETLLQGLDGSLFEFGTLDPGGTPHCYLRRRGPNGKAGPNDFVDVHPGVHCTAIDAAVDAGGYLVVLSQLEQEGVSSWQIDRHDPWSNSLEMLAYGENGTRGNAIAVHRDGAIVVCGAVPSENMDVLDAAMWEVEENELVTFDLVYQQDPKEHQYKEEAHDCTFVGDTLVLVGEAFGFHTGDDKEFKRHAVLEYDIETKETRWAVAPSGPGLLKQSGAQAVVARGPLGYVTAGYACEEDPCFPQLELRAFELGGVLKSTFRPMVETTAPTAIAWHPAGYAIVTAGELKGGFWTKMWAQAWIPGQTDALWTYSRSDTEGVHWALDVAVGRLGWIYLVGVVDLGGPLVPAFVILNP